jgi:hypothetical protein
MNGVTEIDFNNVPTENRFSTLAPSLKNHGYRPPQQQQIYSQPQIYPPQPQMYSPQPQTYPPQPQMYAPQPQMYSPQPQMYAPQQQMYAPQQQMYAPQQQMYAPQQQMYAPQQQIYATQQQMYAPQPQFHQVQSMHPPPMQQFQQPQAQYKHDYYKPNPLEIPKTGEFNMKQQFSRNFTELDPQRFTKLYNTNLQSDITKEEENPMMSNLNDYVIDEVVPISAKLNNLDMNPKSKVKNAISELYDGIVFTKVSETSAPSLSIYKAVVEPNTSSPDVKYLVVIVPNAEAVPLGVEKRLSELNWISFQTRSTLNPQVEFGGFRLRPQRYTIPANSVLHDRIKCVSETPKKWIYKSNNLPIQLEVLIQKENENFAQEGTVIACLEMYQTILSFIN